jgi:hypothetical protein
MGDVVTTDGVLKHDRVPRIPLSNTKNTETPCPFFRGSTIDVPTEILLFDSIAQLRVFGSRLALLRDSGFVF